MKDAIIQFFSPQVPSDIGQVHASWDFPEFIRVKRSQTWYWVVSIILVLLIVYAVYSANFLFAVILVLSAFIFIYQYFQSPRKVPAVIGEDGIIIDRAFYPHKEIKSFYIIYEPPQIKFLYLEFKNKLQKSLAIPLENQNPLEIRKSLLKYLRENLTINEEDFNETFARLLKIR
ncbi:hypothetical protein HZB94_03735 [Candidatus Falkowbacteria bacterium]|nr:hypothetical protein [Candidatus Falkowbacteria bacterium]